MLIIVTFFKPLLSSNITHKWDRVPAEIQGIPSLVHYHFHHIGTEQFVLVANPSNQGSYLCVLLRDQVDEQVDLFRVDERFITLYIHYSIILVLKYV